MRILLLSGGLGTRLLPLTKYTPKIMASIHGKPFLYYLLKWLSPHDIVLSLGYKKDIIKKWCRENKIYLEYIDETEELGTGGALKLAEPFFKNNRKFAVINSDTFLDEDLIKISKAHEGIATIVMAKSILDNELRCAGIYIFSHKIFEYLDRPEKFNLDERLKCIEYNEYISDKKYLDIGSHEGLRYAKEKDIFRGKRWEEK